MRADPPSFAEVWTAAADVDGWLTEGQGRVLHRAAADCPPGGRIVEIGSFRGRSTIVLGLGAGPEVTVVAIDPHAGNDRGPQEIEGFEGAAEDDHARFLANLTEAGVRDRVLHIREFSDRAHDGFEGSIDVLYIDGAHRYEPARADICDWGSRVAVGGTMLVHDSFSSIGVTAAIMRELLWHRRFRYVGRSRSLAEYRKVGVDAGRSRSAWRQLAQLPWFVRNVALKVALTAGLGTVLVRLGRPEPEWPY